MKNTQWLKDSKAVQDYLLAFDLFPAAPQEGACYINHSLKRWRMTLEMLAPPPPGGGKLLELGSSPFLMTLLINKCFDYQLHGVNYTGGDSQPGGRYTFTATAQSLGEQYEFPYDYFNMELERFPYPDHEFDVVLLCEVIEHLTLDPACVLAESHRVLKPGGHIIVTTPNVLRWENLWAMMVGGSIADQYSGYGAYGRHNREYTPLELLRLMQACGFTNVLVKIMDQFEHGGLARLAKRLRHHWRDTIFASGVAEGRPHYCYPDWLYRSMHACRKVLSPLVVVGENDTVQMGHGWYEREKMGSFYARWSRQEAWVHLRCFDGAQQLVLQVCAMARFLGPVELCVEVGSTRRSVKLNGDDWQELGVDLPPDLGRPTTLDVKLEVDQTRVPAHVAGSSDTRELGVLLRQVELR